MATVSKWTPFGVALDITATGGTVTRTSATQFTVVINASWETYYNGASTNYGMSATSGGVTKTISSFGTKRSSGSGQFTGTFSISGNGSASKTISVVFKNFNTDNGDSASKTVSFTVSVPAWTSYTIKYNANGGSGQPSNQTKWKNQTLKLSSTKPTRTGYSFKNWNTASNGSGTSYASGANYTANAAATLYAQWNINTYTVTYNGNGGTVSPTTATKTYNQALTLATATRTDYIFKGWATSATGSVIYPAGSSYTNNAVITLYAVWELDYWKPKVTNATVKWNGSSALVSFNWSTSKETPTITIEWEGSDNSTGSRTVATSGTSGTVNETISSLNVDATYTFHITVTDSGDSTPVTKYLGGTKYPFGMLPENKGVSFGKAPEKENYADFAFKILSRENAEFLNDKSIHGTDTDGTVYSALIPVTASGNTSLGHGLYKAGKGHTHIYGNDVQFYTNGGGVHLNGNDLYFDNNVVIFGTKPDGSIFEAINPQNASGNLVLGYDNYDNKNGLTNIYGYDLNFGVSNITNPGTYRPYRRQGDTLTFTALRTTGYVTNSKTEVSFVVPLAMPVIGSPTVTVTSVNGFILRQGNNYTHGSTASAYATPTSYTASCGMTFGVHITAKFSDTTNATNNDAIGIYWSGTITFS